MFFYKGKKAVVLAGAATPAFWTRVKKRAKVKEYKNQNPDQAYNTANQIFLHKIKGLPSLKSVSTNVEEESFALSSILLEPVSIDSKLEALVHLIRNKGYRDQVDRLFITAFSLSEKKSDCIIVLWLLYCDFEGHIRNLSKATEYLFWHECFRALKLTDLIDTYESIDELHKKYRFLKTWIDWQTVPQRIIEIYEHIKNECPLSQADLQQFHKIAKQRILNIGMSNPEIIQGAEVRTFLAEHRRSWFTCFTCFIPRKTRSMDIYYQIATTHGVEAFQAWRQEEEKMEDFYKKHRMR